MRFRERKSSVEETDAAYNEAVESGNKKEDHRYSGSEISAVNSKFNEELSTLTQENADKKIFCTENALSFRQSPSKFGIVSVNFVSFCGCKSIEKTH